MAQAEPTPAIDAPLDEKDERSRSRLLRAAVDVFDRKGYAAASVREIVEQAGVSKPALYYHFGSKDGVVGAILQEGFRQFDRVLSRAVDRSGNAHARLTGLCDDICALFTQAVPLVRVARALCCGPVEGAPRFDSGVFERSLDAAVRRIVEDGVASGELRAAPVSDMTTAITGVFLGCTGSELHRSGSAVDHGDLHRILDLVFEGLGAASGKFAREEGEPNQ